MPEVVNHPEAEILSIPARLERGGESWRYFLHEIETSPPARLGSRRLVIVLLVEEG